MQIFLLSVGVLCVLVGSLMVSDDLAGIKRTLEDIKPTGLITKGQIENMLSYVKRALIGAILIFVGFFFVILFSSLFSR